MLCIFLHFCTLESTRILLSFSVFCLPFWILFFVSTEKFRNFNIEKEHSTERPATKQSAEKQIFETETQQICSQHYRAVVASSLYLCSPLPCSVTFQIRRRKEEVSGGGHGGCGGYQRIKKLLTKPPNMV